MNDDLRRGRGRQTAGLLLSALLLTGVTACAGTAQAGTTTERPVVGLITKTGGSAYFQALRKGAEQEGAALGVRLHTYAGTQEDDTTSQVEAIHELMADGARGILITPAGKDVLPAIAEARAAGLFVVALDSPLDPVTAVDATFATDNFAAGQSIGQWAAGVVDPATAKIAMLDLNADHVPVDVARDQGFLDGFGIGLGDPAVIGDETDPRVVGHELTNGDADGGAKAMTTLLAAHPDLNVVYTINEGSAEGAAKVLAAAGRTEDVLLVSIDGGCAGVADVKSGTIGATAMQFPLRMARLGLDAVIDHSLTGDVPPTSGGLDFFNTGSQLVTDRPVDGLYSKDTTWGAEKCWG